MFHMAELEFMGHLLSTRGIGPTKTKVDADLAEPEDQSGYQWSGVSLDLPITVESLFLI